MGVCQRCGQACCDTFCNVCSVLLLPLGFNQAFLLCLSLQISYSVFVFNLSRETCIRGSRRRRRRWQIKEPVQCRIVPLCLLGDRWCRWIWWWRRGIIAIISIFPILSVFAITPILSAFAITPILSISAISAISAISSRRTWRTRWYIFHQVPHFRCCKSCFPCHRFGFMLLYVIMVHLLFVLV